MNVGHDSDTHHVAPPTVVTQYDLTTIYADLVDVDDPRAGPAGVEMITPGTFFFMFLGISGLLAGIAAYLLPDMPGWMPWLLFLCILGHFPGFLPKAAHGEV